MTMTHAERVPLPSLAPSFPLSMSPAHFRAVGHAVVELAASHLETRREQPVFQPMPATVRKLLLHQELPECGQSIEELLASYESTILPYPMGNDHPRFHAWVNSGPAPIGILADFLTALSSSSCANGDHAALYQERCVVRWLMELVGFPVEGSMGILVEGGSLASLYGLTAARHWASLKDGWNVRKQGLQYHHRPLILYVSSEGHSCLVKATELLGLGAPHIVPADDDYRMDVQALASMVAQDRKAGLRPFCVAATAGTVSTGAIDPLEDLASFCEEQGLWLHVDGAMGAFGILDPERTHLYAGLERAHSLALDPHKWFAVPIDCSCAIVRDGNLLRETFSLVPPYLRMEEGKGFGGLPGFAEYGFKQTQRNLALKLAWVMQYAGRTGLAQLVSQHNALAQQLAILIDDADDLEQLAPVTLCIVCFRYVPERLRGDDARLNVLNKRIMETVQERGNSFLHSTLLQGRLALRACIMHYETTADDIAALVEEIRLVGDLCAREEVTTG
jgi:aromatic-L-amino-acid decarboxylase